MSDKTINGIWADVFGKHLERLERFQANETTMDFCGMEIHVDKDTLAKYREWYEKVSLPMEEQGTIGGEFTYCITPTSLACIYVVKHARGEEFDLTNYNLW
jgi:hypothetical protein